jgi:hypothetical protein
MNKKIMIPFMGLALIGFVGCSDVAAPEYNAPTKSKYNKVAANPAPTQFQNQGQMVNYCKGMIAGEVNTKPINVQMESLVIEKGVKPASKVSGTVYGKKYTCEFDSEGKYFDIHPAY